MIEGQLRELEIRIARYRFLEREVTDPLAEYLLHSIVVDLEANLQLERGRKISQRVKDALPALSVGLPVRVPF